MRSPDGSSKVPPSDRESTAPEQSGLNAPIVTHSFGRLVFALRPSLLLAVFVSALTQRLILEHRGAADF